jgi:N-acetylglutamate synthase-like GNAT family acetyltransferase
MIRKADAKDQEAIEQLQKQLNRPARSDSVVSDYFVAESERQIIGCGAVRKRHTVGYLYGLGVHKDWRRRGIGHALTEARLDWLRSQQAERAFVLVMFWNVSFFRKRGFTLANRRSTENLGWLHGDFNDGWSKKSALLQVESL